MSQEEIDNNIEKKLKRWKWIISTTVSAGVILVVFLSNMLANKIFYEEDIQKLKSDMNELKKTVEFMSYNFGRFADANEFELKENPFSKK